MGQRFLLLMCFCFLHASALVAAERWSIGLTANDKPIEAVVVAGPSAQAPTVLLIGGLQGPDATVDVVKQEATTFEALPAERRPFRLIALALANPEARPLQFPPTGAAYNENAESHVLWRWIGIHAPDLAVIVGESGKGLGDALSQSSVAFVGRIPSRVVTAKSGFSHHWLHPFPLPRLTWKSTED